MRTFGTLGAARHLMALLARGRSDRAATIEQAIQLLRDVGDPHWARRILLMMEHAGRIVDIYPLELMAEIVERWPGYLPQVVTEPLILNRDAIAASVHEVGAVIALKVPLSAKLKSFALKGGGRPGYVFAPGPPATYLLEVHEAGRFEFLLLGELKRARRLDKVQLQIGQG